nr:MAG TPA: hypothetical protein [Caudoviricetes sp.]
MCTRHSHACNNIINGENRKSKDGRVGKHERSILL